MNFSTFIFDNYAFDAGAKTLSLQYKIDDSYSFTETYVFDFAFCKDIDTAALDRAVQTLFFLAGVSYYKTFLPSEIVVRKGSIDQTSATFYSKTYQRGLGEFFYVNQLDPTMPINFPVTQAALPQLAVTSESNGLLVGIGGGKDSLVSIELLRNTPHVATWSLNHRSQLKPLIDAIGTPHLWVERQIDAQLLQLKDNPDAYNGHVPISAIFAAAGTVAAILGGYKYSVVSNENSANEPTLIYNGVEINHQYSKSLEFEQDFQQHLEHNLSNLCDYFSFLRPLSELAIGELFAKIAFQKYKHIFSSCNRAFVHGETEMSWCGECPKCAFTFLLLTPFIDRHELETVWGKNLLLDEKLEMTYRQLLGIEGDKPLDCVGEIKESRAAMRLAQKQYPELDKYEFDIPEGYNYHELAPSSMPQEVLVLLQSAIS